MTSNGRRDGLFRILVTFMALLVAMFATIPIVLIVARGLGGMDACLRSEEVVFAVKLSLMTSAVSTAICTLISLPVAYALTRYRFPFKNAVSTLIYLPMSLPHLVSGIALLLVFGGSGLGGILSKLGIDFVFTVNGIIMAQVFVNIPFMVKMLTSTIEGASPRLEFVARTLGCNIWQAFSRVTLPLVASGLITAIIMTWSRAVGEFGAVLMLAGATRFKTETLPISIFLSISTGDLELALSTATILISVSLASIISFELLARRERDPGKNADY